MPIIPKYREGFPKLDMVQAKAAMERDQPVCVFRGQTGTRRGYLIVEVNNEGRLCVEFDLYAEYLHADRGRRLFLIVKAPIRANPDRHFVKCPRCEKPIITLFFTCRWACADCHGLAYRSQHTGKEVLERERNLARRDELKPWFAGGKPDGMWQATADRLQRELADLEAWLESEPMVVASKRHAQVVSGTWMGVEEAERRHLIPLRSLAPKKVVMDPSAIVILRDEY